MCLKIFRYSIANMIRRVKQNQCGGLFVTWLQSIQSRSTMLLSCSLPVVIDKGNSPIR